MLGHKIGILLVVTMLSLALISESFAETIFVEFDKSEYKTGEKLTFSGSIPEYSMPIVAVSIYDPKGKILSANNLELDGEGNFSKTISLDSPFYEINSGNNNPDPINPEITTNNANACVVNFTCVTHNHVSAFGVPTGYTLGENNPNANNQQQATAYLLDVGAAGAETPAQWDNTESSSVAEFASVCVALKLAGAAAAGNPWNYYAQQ